MRGRQGSPLLKSIDSRHRITYTTTSRSDLLMAQTFLLDALDFAGDLMPLVQPAEQGAEAEAEPRFLNIYLVRACVPAKQRNATRCDAMACDCPPRSVCSVILLANNTIIQSPTLQPKQLGSQGIGKTAFLRTLTSVLQQTPPPTAPALGPEDAVAAGTAELDRVNLAKLLLGEARFRRPLTARVFDLWGAFRVGIDRVVFVQQHHRLTFSPSTQSKSHPIDKFSALDDTDELQGILSGLAPVGFTPAHRLSALSAQDRTDLEGSKGQRAADAALFFVGATDLEDPLKMERLKAAFDAAKAALGGHAPLIVLGRADAVDAKLLSEPLNWSNKKVRPSETSSLLYLSMHSLHPPTP